MFEFQGLPTISRIFYGDNENNKPDEDCFYDEDGIPPGWYETDQSLKKRILANLKNSDQG